MHIHEWQGGVCENCGELRRDVEIESAERAVIEAAEQWRDEDLCGDLIRAVDALRKAREGR